MGPWTTRLSSSHLPGALPTPLAFLSGQEREEEEEGEGEISKRSHRPRVVAGIPGADFICRMSTSRGPVGTGGGIERTQNATGRRERERERGAARPWDPDRTQTRQHRTAINSPLDLSCLTAPIGARGSYYPRGLDHFSSPRTPARVFSPRPPLPIISTLLSAPVSLPVPLSSLHFSLEGEELVHDRKDFERNGSKC